MSVTFYPEIQEGDSLGFQGKCGDAVVFECETYREARRRADSHGASCSECIGYGAEIEELTDVPSFNANNANAAYVLGLLCLRSGGCDLSGSSDPEVFLHRVFVRSGIARGKEGPDQGVPAREFPGTGARFIDCGRRDGYGDYALGELRKVAEWCVEHKRLLCWA